MKRYGNEPWDRVGYADAVHRLTGVLAPANLPSDPADREQALAGFLRKLEEIARRVKAAQHSAFLAACDRSDEAEGKADA